MPIESISSRQNPDRKHAEKSVPRFTSFKPSTPSKPDITPDKSRSTLFNKQTLAQNHRWEDHEPSPKRKLNSRNRSEPTGKDFGPRENIAKSFIVDRVGDVNNLKFDALDRYATASYLRFGTGKVVGSPRNQKIDRAVSTDKGLVLSDDTNGLPKNGDRHARWKLDQEGAREMKIKPCEKHDSDVDSADYISLEVVQRAKRRRGHDRIPVSCASSSSDEYDTHYRSLEGKAISKKEPADQDLKYNSDTSSSQDIFGRRPPALDDFAQMQRVQLSRRIDAEPANLEAWIRLISHQDKMLGLGSHTNAERRSNAEIKISIFEKALEKVKNAQDREVLLLGLMQEASRIWETGKVSSRWKSIIQQNSQNLRLWIKYLDFMQTSFTYFRFEEVQSAYLDCLNIIHGARTSGKISSDERDSVFDIQIYVLLRMTLFMRESGFVEHATAAWQALLEFVFFKPITDQAGDDYTHRSPDEATVSMFEKFWDSEVPRIGEEGAEGWASFLQKQGKPPQPRNERADDLKDSKDDWQSWLASEQRHSLLSRNPARTTDDIEENDPYRIVLMSDIRPFLIGQPSLVGQQLVLDAFVAFCCLPPFAAEGPDSRSRVWERDCFLRNDALRLGSKLQNLWNLRFPKDHGMSEEHDSIDEADSPLQLGTQDPFLLPVRDYQVSSDSLFAGKHWFSAFNIWQEQCSGDGGPVETAWVLRSLKSLMNICIRKEAVALYVLALELRISPETVKKTAKSVLRKRPFSIRLYNAYALIEYRSANIEKGEGIITTSINMGKTLDKVSQRDTILLWRTWIWETLSAKSARDALMRLLAIGDEEIQMPFPKLHAPDYVGSVEPTLLLRTEKTLVATRDSMLSLSSYSQANFAIECLILFAYLRNGQSLHAATLAFKSNIALLSIHVSSNSSYHEYLHQSFARLLYHHATHTHMFKPSDIRSLLADTIGQFPQNTIFLSLYAWNEARFRIDDRLRSLVKEVVLSGSDETGIRSHDNVIPHFFAIFSELRRAVTFGSNVSTVRSTFERAVQSNSGAHCAGLWKLYLIFEYSRYEAEKAKMVFWRGLRACPWAKDLYMLAFKYLRGGMVMGEADLRGIYQLLGVKELRVHVGLGDVFEGSGE